MESTITLGNLTIDTDSCEVRINDRPVHLSFLQYELLLELARHQGRLVTRSQLLTSLWNNPDEGAGRKLSVHICRLRSKVRESHPWSIVSIRQRGYVLKAVNDG